MFEVDDGEFLNGDMHFDYPLRKWKWPLTKWYNGFSPVERIRCWQVGWWLCDYGLLNAPGKELCSLCGSNYMVQWHNENYYAPWDAQTVCKPCHKTLHGRFTEPGAWNDLAERAALRLGALALAFSF